MDIKIPNKIIELFEKFQKSNFQLYLVGGSVRDLLMRRKVSDWDFTTDAKPEEILKICPTGFYNNKFGTVGIPINIEVINNQPEAAKISSHAVGRTSEASDKTEHEDIELPSIVEITTMRKEGDYKDHRHPTKVGWTNKIEEDLARRDFTINAIALSVKISKEPTIYSIEIIDLFAGQTDLKNNLIKAVGDPNQRFKEDALRLMRAVRFSAQLGFEIEEKTFQAIKENSHTLKEIAWERIRDELFKLLAATNAYDGLLKLRKTGILQIILPEVEECFGIMQEGPKHDRIYDIGEHSLKTMRETPSKDPLVKFAALLHDIGKAKTHNIEEDGNVTFYNHDLVGANISLQISKRFNLSNTQTDKIYKLIRWHMFSTNENQTDSAIRRFIKNVGLENIEDIMALRIGDRLGGDTRTPVSWRMEEFRKRIDQVLEKPFSITDLKVSGNDVMEILKISPSPKVGQILNKLFEEVLENSEKNTREYLTNRIKSLMT